jgi:hypothetical protein
MPILFACPRSLKKLRGGRHVPTLAQLASKCHLKELGGGGYVPTLIFYIPMPFWVCTYFLLYIHMPLEKLEEGRHVPIPLNGKLITKLFEGYQILKSFHQIKPIIFTYYRCFKLN